MFAALCVWLCGLVLLSAGPVRAAPLSDCTAHRGTVVAVDFAHWGGPIARGCGVDQPSGYALLHAAGFTTAGDAHDGAAFICRIGDQAFDGGTMHPTPSEDPCNGTPSTSAYWSYWLAPAGQNTWTYSPIGPMGDVPKPGEVELWMFGASNVGGTRGSGVPRFPPSALRAATGAPPTRGPAPTTSAPTTTTRTASAPASRTTTRHRSTAGRGAATGRPQPGRPARTRTRAPKPGRRAAAGSASVASARRTRPTVVSAKPTAERTSAGSVGPLVVGLCLALAMTAGAVWTVWRRRRQEEQ
jgi:hypothetical protein